MKSEKDKDIKQKKSLNSETDKNMKPEDPVLEKFMKNEQKSKKTGMMKNKYEEINQSNINREKSSLNCCKYNNT